MSDISAKYFRNSKILMIQDKDESATITRNNLDEINVGGALHRFGYKIKYKTKPEEYNDTLIMVLQETH